MNINSFIDNRKSNVKNLFQEALGIKSIPVAISIAVVITKYYK